jgi:hypothetical protein
VGGSLAVDRGQVDRAFNQILTPATQPDYIGQNISFPSISSMHAAAVRPR